MRGAYRGGDNTLRWALVGGIVVVVVIATIIAIAGGLGKSGAPTPTPTPGVAKGCLYPKTVHVRALPLRSPAIRLKGINPVTARDELVADERVIARYGATHAALDVSPAGKRFVYLTTLGSRVVVRRPSGRPHKLKIHAEDVALSANGRLVIYEKNAKYTKYACAKTVLMAVGLSGKHRHLFFAGRYALTNSPPGTGLAASAQGTIQTDELSTGWMVLTSGDRLWIFNPKQHVVAPVETKALGPLYPAGQPAQHFLVSPNLKYMVKSAQGGNSLQVVALPSLRQVYQYSGATAPSWSHSGKRLAFVVIHQGVNGVTSDVVKTVNLSTLKLYTARPDRRKLGPVTLANIRWAHDDRWIAFTGSRLGNCTSTIPGNCAKALVFLSTWKGKGVHVVNRAVLGSPATPAATPTPTGSTHKGHKKHRKKKKGTVPTI